MDGPLKTSTFFCLVVCTLITFVRFANCATYLSRCTIEDCHTEYAKDMDEFGLSVPEKSPVYCQCLSKYLACIKTDTNKLACRGDLHYAAIRSMAIKFNKDFCIHSNDKSWKERNTEKLSTESSSPHPQEDVSSSFEAVSPSCKYFGNNKFKHCASYGKPHLKTFDGKYQTCRTNGTWTLVDNPYVLVQVTSGPEVARESTVTASMTKIVIVIRSKSNLCTLEKRYEADSSSSLPITFIDGTDRPGADETVTLRFQYYEGNVEIAEIYMKYIATKLIVRKVGKYLSFSVKIPEEVADTSRAYNAEQQELCTAGCPAHERLDTWSGAIGKFHVRDDRALDECKETKMLYDDYQSVLTDSFLDWCVFDAQTAGISSELIETAHWALADARDGDPGSLKNRTTLMEVPYTDKSGSSKATSLVLVQLLIHVTLVLIVCKFLL